VPTFAPVAPAVSQCVRERLGPPPHPLEPHKRGPCFVAGRLIWRRPREVEIGGPEPEPDTPAGGNQSISQVERPGIA
jgi:hypothetical protein